MILEFKHSYLFGSRPNSNILYKNGLTKFVKRSKSRDRVLLTCLKCYGSHEVRPDYEIESEGSVIKATCPICKQQIVDHLIQEIVKKGG